MYRINATALGWVGGRVGPIFCCIPGIVSEKVSYVVRRVGAGVGERGGLTMAVFLAETPSGYCLMLCYNARFICLLLFSFVVVPYSLPSRCHPPPPYLDILRRLRHLGVIFGGPSTTAVAFFFF